MVRTKNTANVRVVGEKASRKSLPTPAASTSKESSSGNKYSGGNPYCPRETPAWQKPITDFFGAAPSKSGEKSNAEGCAGPAGPSSSTSTSFLGLISKTSGTNEK